MKIDMDRLLRNLNKINHIGNSKEKGITRLALTDEDMEGRSALKELFSSLNMSIREDNAGNIWALKEGKDNTLPKVMLGSHIDTVPEGGRYDGTLGVIAAVECIMMMKDQGIENLHPIEIVSFSTEESSRFNISTMGSKMAAGLLNSSELKEFSDKDGNFLHNILAERGFNRFPAKKIDPKEIKAFLELHIEQGPGLEKKGTEIGLVEGIAAPTRLTITLCGDQAHSGGCQMEYRRDALTAAAEIILKVEEAGRQESPYWTVATVGKLEVLPGVMNVIPGNAVIYIDIRGVDQDSISRVLNFITDGTEKICQKRKITNTMKIISQETPVVLDQKLLNLVEENCKKLNLSCRKMSSGAGHDSMNMSKIVPSALIFVPCIGGISHSKNENMNITDIENGVKVLYETMISLSC